MEFSEMEHSIDRLWAHINKLESRLNSALDRLEKSNLEVAAMIAQKAQDVIDDANYDVFAEYREEDG